MKKYKEPAAQRFLMAIHNLKHPTLKTCLSEIISIGILNIH